MIAKLKTDDFYQEVVDIIKEKSPYYCDYLVSLDIGGDITSEILQFDAPTLDYIWQNDWWEGEKEVILLGFAPTRDIILHGYLADPIDGTIQIGVPWCL